MTNSGADADGLMSYDTSVIDDWSLVEKGPLWRAERSGGSRAETLRLAQAH